MENITSNNHKKQRESESGEQNVESREESLSFREKTSKDRLQHESSRQEEASRREHCQHSFAVLQLSLCLFFVIFSFSA